MNSRSSLRESTYYDPQATKTKLIKPPSKQLLWIVGEKVFVSLLVLIGLVKQWPRTVATPESALLLLGSGLTALAQMVAVVRIEGAFDVAREFFCAHCGAFFQRTGEFPF